MRRTLTLGLAAAWLIASPAMAVSVFGRGGGSSRPRVPGIDDTPPVQWRETYGVALSEAKLKGRPLLIFFHEMNKGARMTEMGTFDDARVKARMGRFVPVQVDVGLDEDVARKYGLAVTQAVVIADPEEKKLTELPGNPDFDTVSKAMDAAIQKLGNPPTDAQIAEMAARFEAAKKAVESERYSSAQTYLKPLLASKAMCGVVTGARELSKRIDAAGAEKIAAAQALYDAKKYDEAKALCRKIAAEFRGTEVEKSSAALRKKIETDPAIRGAADARRNERTAAGLMKIAARYERSKKYSLAVSSYEKVVALGGTSFLPKAEEVLKRLKDDPAVAKAIVAEKAAREARSLWSRANSWIANGNVEKAAELLRKLVKEHSKSPYAKKAEAKLKQMGMEIE